MTHQPTDRPHLPPEQVLEFATDRYSIPFTRAVPLPSDRDQNFLLSDTGSERRYVLKIARSGEDREVLDFQNRMLEHLGRAGFSLSKVIFAKDGREIVKIPGPDRSVYLTRLLTWIPGDLFWQARPQTPALLDSLGAFLGGMDHALEDFSHPAQDRPLAWNLMAAGEVIERHRSDVQDRVRSGLLDIMSDRLLGLLEPLAPELRTSVIHNDANDHNVLIRALRPGEGPEARRVVGILDFGDAVRSYTVAEAAVGAAYAMLGQADLLSLACHVVRGYHRVYPLTEAEIAAIFPLIGLRLCVSVTMAAFQRAREPDNHYLSVSEIPAWNLLERLEGMSPDLAHCLFRQACGLDPLPHARSVVSWLKEHGSGAAPVLGAAPSNSGTAAGAVRAEHEMDPPSLPDLERRPVHVFDLSVDSREFGLTPGSDDVEGWTDLIFGKMRSVGAEVGIGRYDEVRGLYTSYVFQNSSDGALEWRTLHLGIDLFVEAGAEVRSPFDAVVYSVVNNDRPLDYGPTVILEHRIETGTGTPGPAGARSPAGTTHPQDAARSGSDTSDGTLRFWTLYGHLDQEVLDRLSAGMSVGRGEAFARVGPFPENGNWPPHLHFQIMTDTLGMTGDFPGVARPSQRELWKTIVPDPNLILNIPEPAPGRTGPVLVRGTVEGGRARPGLPTGAPLTPSRGGSREEILEIRRRHLGPTLSVSYQKPLKIVRGHGQFLVDEDGQSYLDCVNNVPHVGHSHPRVVRAACRQMALLNTNTRYLHDSLVEYAERLTALLPDSLSVVYFVCSGSEANELALRMARAHTHREDVLVVEGAYHGNTSSLVQLSPYKFNGPGGEPPPPWVHTTLMPDPYRGRYRGSAGDPLPRGGAAPSSNRDSQARTRGGPSLSHDGSENLPPEELGERYAEHVAEVITRMDSDGYPVAAFFCEPLLGCGGQIVPPEGYLPRAFDHVRRAGGVCVADEVQVGFGRVGSHFWAFETQGVVPDIVTLGKPMGNGHPLGAVVTTPEIAASFDTGMEYFNTFGGNPVSCAVGLAVLDVLEDEGLQENARRVGSHLLAGLRDLQDQHPLIGDVRGLGLYAGVELVTDRETREPAPKEASRVKERLRDHRILLSTDGPDDNVLKIKPPLVFTEEDADRLVSRLDLVLEEDGLRM